MQKNETVFQNNKKEAPCTFLSFWNSVGKVRWQNISIIKTTS